MRDRALARAGAILVAAMFAVALAQAALGLDWDLRFPLWDKALHLAAALGVAMTLASRDAWRRVGVVMALGFGWECAQALYETETALSSTHLIDTAADLAADAIGALALGVRPRHSPIDDALHV